MVTFLKEMIAIKNSTVTKIADELLPPACLRSIF
jgi:hypothetical protein